MDREQLEQWIKKHEGYEDNIYMCSAGKLSIGYGRNLQDNGISKDEAEYLFDSDINRTYKDLSTISWYHQTPTAIQDALFNMCFNLGLSRLLTFKKMIKAILEKNYNQAAREALDSKWAKQVGDRAKDIALMIRNAK